MAKSNVKGWEPIPDTATRLQREMAGEESLDFYGEHTFKKGDCAKWKDGNGFGFFAINGISAEKLVKLKVCSKEIDKEEKTVKYEMLKDCTVRISHGGTEKFARKGVEEVRNITLYEIV